MSTPKNSIESQLRTKCSILESQVETLEKKIMQQLPEKFTRNIDIDDLPFKIPAQWKEVEGIGKFPE